MTRFPGRILWAAALLAAAFGAPAQTLEISGSTPVVKELLQTNAAAIRHATGVEVKSYAMTTGRGMIALFEGKSAVAAVSEPLDEAMASARRAMVEAGVNLPVPPNLVYHEVGRERVAVFVHKDNPVTALSRAQLKDLFTGKVRNWKQVGGPDLPVKVLLSSAGSATRSIVQKQVLDGGAYAADAAEFRTGLGAISEVAKERGGIAASGVMLSDYVKSGSVRIVQTPVIDRPTGFVTVGKPSEAAQKVIDFLRKKA